MIDDVCCTNNIWISFSSDYRRFTIRNCTVCVVSATCTTCKNCTKCNSKITATRSIPIQPFWCFVWRPKPRRLVIPNFFLFSLSSSPLLTDYFYGFHFFFLVLLIICFYFSTYHGLPRQYLYLHASTLHFHDLSSFSRHQTLHITVCSLITIVSKFSTAAAPCFDFAVRHHLKINNLRLKTVVIVCWQMSQMSLWT